jgi:hypothetical protein
MAYWAGLEVRRAKRVLREDAHQRQGRQVVSVLPTASSPPRSVSHQEPLPLMERHSPLSSLPLPGPLIGVVGLLDLESLEVPTANPVAYESPGDAQVLGDG